MTRRVNSCVVLATVGAWLLAISPAWCVAPEIKDEGRFFSPEAVRKADDQIREIKRKFDRDLLVETYLSAPPEQLEKIRTMSRDERNHFFHNWAAERLQHAVVNGVYVLVCKEPPHLQVEVNSKPPYSIDSKARGQLIEVLLKHFHAKQYDEALEAAVKSVRDRFSTVTTK
jgi:hypothetical protein